MNTRIVNGIHVYLFRTVKKSSEILLSSVKTFVLGILEFVKDSSEGGNIFLKKALIYYFIF